MDIQDQIRRWITQKLKERGHGSRSELAVYLGVRRDVVTRMLSTTPGKETRVIRAEELVKISDFFGDTPPGLNGEKTLDDEFIQIYQSVDDTTKAEIQAYLKYLVDTKNR